MGDGTVTNFVLGKKYVDGYVLLTDDICGSAIPERAKGNIFKCKVSDFDEKEHKFTLKYSAQAMKDNGYVWINFPDAES